MKLRFHNDSVRVRLNQGEVTRLAAGERIEQTTFFSPSSKFVSSIESVSGIPEMVVSFDDAHLSLRLPRLGVLEWAQSEEAGIETSQVIDPSRSLEILIEKDFACLHGGDPEENEDAFPNPRAASSR